MVPEQGPEYEEDNERLFSVRITTDVRLDMQDEEAKTKEKNEEDGRYDGKNDFEPEASIATPIATGESLPQLMMMLA